MLQTIDFLKFSKNYFLKHTSTSDSVFDRVVQSRNVSYYFTKKWFL